MPKISVIIPAFNAKETLRRCLESVASQDFASLEIIVVNDGSTDETLEIAREYEKSTNFVLIDQAHGGVSRARWTGIGSSRGKYLAFVDADDFIAKDMMSKMYGTAEETGAEVVACGWYRVREGKAFPLQMYQDIVPECGVDAVTRTVIRESWGSLCNKLILRDLIHEEDFTQAENLGYYEDTILLVYAMSRAQKVSYLPECFYYYVDSEKSATNKPSLKTLKDLSFAITLLFNFFMASNIVEWSRFAPGFFSSRLAIALRLLNRLPASAESAALKK